MSILSPLIIITLSILNTRARANFVEANYRHNTGKLRVIFNFTRTGKKGARIFFPWAETNIN